MKALISILVLSIVSLSSCKEEYVAPTPLTEVGQWYFIIRHVNLEGSFRIMGDDTYTVGDIVINGEAWESGNISETGTITLSKGSDAELTFVNSKLTDNLRFMTNDSIIYRKGAFTSFVFKNYAISRQ